MLAKINFCRTAGCEEAVAGALVVSMVHPPPPRGPSHGCIGGPLRPHRRNAQWCMSSGVVVGPQIVLPARQWLFQRRGIQCRTCWPMDQATCLKIRPTATGTFNSHETTILCKEKLGVWDYPVGTQGWVWLLVRKLCASAGKSAKGKVSFWGTVRCEALWRLCVCISQASALAEKSAIFG